MRVLVVENAVGFGGSTVCAGQIVDACLRSGIEPFLLISYESRGVGANLPTGSTWRLDAYRLFRWGLSVRRWCRQHAGALPGAVQSAVFAVVWFLCERPVALQLAARLRRERIDVVHANNDLLNNRIGIVAGHAAGVLVISHQRGWQWPGRFPRRLAKKVGCFIAVSRAVARDLSHVVSDTSRIRQIYDGVDCSAFAAETSKSEPAYRFGISADRLVIGMPAMFVGWKGHDVFLRAFARLTRTYDHLHALFVGDAPDDDETIRSSLRELAAELGIADRVRFAPFCGSPATALRCMDIVVHASIRPEPLGLTVLEAMAAGKPVVAADDGGVRETVIHDRTGLLFRPADAKDLADCLERLVRDSSLRATLGASARRHVEVNFDIRLSQDSILDLYHQGCPEDRSRFQRKVICRSRPCFS